MENLLVQVEEHNGVLVTTSNRVAEELGVEHKNLIAKIEDYIRKFSKAKSLALGENLDFTEFYIPSTYKVEGNFKPYKNYLITQKGIAQLLGGYSSAVKVAFELNVAYINEFERMREFIKEKSQPQPTLPKTYKEALIELLAQVEENEKLQLENQELKPKAQYTEDVLKSESLLTITQIAKDLKMTGQKLNKLLHGLGVQYKKGGKWYIYEKYQDCGYAKYDTNILPNGNTVHNLKWTEKGRKFIIDLLNDTFDSLDLKG